MEISDLISIISIILAIIAFLNENERELIFNKFSRNDVIILLLYFIFVNYLIFFESLLSRFPDTLSNFINNKLPSAKVWAYILSVLMISWVLWKVFWGKFPKKNNISLFKFYNNLLQQNKYDLILKTYQKFTPESNFVVEKIINNSRFLNNTSSYNEELIKSIIENKDYKSSKLFLTNNYIESQLTNEHSCLLSEFSLSEFHLELLKNDIDLFSNVCKSLKSKNYFLVSHNELIIKYLFKRKELLDKEKEFFKSLVNELFSKKNNLFIYKYFKSSKRILKEYKPTLETIKFWLETLLDSIESNSLDVSEFSGILISLVKNEKLHLIKDIFINDKFKKTRTSLYNLIKNDKTLQIHLNEDLLKLLGNY